MIWYYLAPGAVFSEGENISIFEADLYPKKWNIIKMSLWDITVPSCGITVALSISSCGISSSAHPTPQSRIYTLLYPRGLHATHTLIRWYQYLCACPNKYGAFTQCCLNVGPVSNAMGQNWNSIGPAFALATCDASNSVSVTLPSLCVITSSFSIVVWYQ